MDGKGKEGLIPCFTKFSVHGYWMVLQKTSTYVIYFAQTLNFRDNVQLVQVLKYMYVIVSMYPIIVCMLCLLSCVCYMYAIESSNHLCTCPALYSSCNIVTLC